MAVEQLSSARSRVDEDGFHLHLGVDGTEVHVRVKDVSIARELLSAVSGLRPFIDQMQRAGRSDDDDAYGAFVDPSTGGNP